MERITVRRSGPDGAEAIAKLFTETVHAVNAIDYDPGQLLAWAPEPLSVVSWRERLGKAKVLVATRDGQIIGFAAFTADGYLDLLYTHAHCLRQGVATALLLAIENEARALRVDHLSAEVSITARPFFEHAGFRLTTEQTVERRGQRFLNYRMEKRL